MALTHVMTAAKFKTETKKFWSRRNGAIAKIDQKLTRAHSSPGNRAALQDLRDAIDAFIAEKDDKFGKKNGGDYRDSKRNKKQAIELLSQQVDQELQDTDPVHAKLRKVGQHVMGINPGRAHLVRAAPPPAYKTMTDADMVQLFVQEARARAVGWNGLTKKQRGEKLFEALDWVHFRCNIPRAGIDVKVLPPGYLGFFDSNTWSLQLSEEMFDFLLPDNLGTINAQFVYVAEILYHEGRHCEQWFHMARLQANTYTTEADALSELWHSYGMKSHDACTEAFRRKMKPGDMLYDLTRGWFKSVYGMSGRNIVLNGLALKRTDMRGEQADRAAGWGNGIHAQYSGKLPEEVDAWGIQDLVRAEFGPV